MASNLVSCDSYSGKIYLHSGITSIITTSFASPDGIPEGLTYDGINLVSCDTVADKIYLHSGITSTITTSFNSSDNYPFGLAYDGINLVSCERNEEKIYIHSGITSIITTSFATPSGNPSGLTYDGTNLVSCDYGRDKIYLHLGITSTITTSFATPSGSPTGLAYDGTNLVSCDSTIKKIYLHSGITSIITTSFASPGDYPSGLVCIPLVIPTVTTQAVSDIQETTATGNGTITDTGGENCHTRGFCYKEGIAGDPTISDSKVYDNGAGSYGVGAYSKGITGLTQGVFYRVRAYATNSGGTGYGTTVGFQILGFVGGIGFANIELGLNGVDGSYTFTANDCRKVRFHFTEIKEGPFELANYDLTQFKQGVRFEAEIFFTALTPHNTTLDAFLKIMESYSGTIYCTPHLDYPNVGNPRKYKVLKDGGWDYDYFKDKWMGFAGGIKLIGIKLLSEPWAAES